MEKLSTSLTLYDLMCLKICCCNYLGDFGVRWTEDSDARKPGTPGLLTPTVRRLERAGQIPGKSSFKPLQHEQLPIHR